MSAMRQKRTLQKSHQIAQCWVKIAIPDHVKNVAAAAAMATVSQNANGLSCLFTHDAPGPVVQDRPVEIWNKITPRKIAPAIRNATPSPCSWVMLSNP